MSLHKSELPIGIKASTLVLCFAMDNVLYAFMDEKKNFLKLMEEKQTFGKI